jgi:acetyl-CoA C-acetyltransferase
MTRIVIVDAKRTPFGRFRGRLSQKSPVELAVSAAQPILARIDSSKLDQVIVGNVLAAGHGMNVARQISIGLGIPVQTPSWTVNMMCGSGMQSAIAGVHSIRVGEAKSILVGGTESMSQSRLLLPRPIQGQRAEQSEPVDSMLQDGLIDSFSHVHMGVQVEQLAKKYRLTREEQDAFAYRSQQLHFAAHQAHALDDGMVAIDSMLKDEHPRPNVSRTDLAQLQPVFEPNGSITAGNASGVNDGAAMLLLADRDHAKQHGWPILAEWIDGVSVGCEPERMGLGPIYAIRSLMKRTDRSWNQIDTLEINEAFAAQTLSCLKELELSINLDSIDNCVQTFRGQPIEFNSHGGAIALGHPLAASGARILGHLAWSISRGNSQAAIGSLCIGGGMGIAVLLARDTVD